jgi:hypothetical protein
MLEHAPYTPIAARSIFSNGICIISKVARYKQSEMWDNQVIFWIRNGLLHGFMIDSAICICPLKAPFFAMLYQVQRCLFWKKKPWNKPLSSSSTNTI